MERFVGPDAGETRPAGGVPVSAEERSHEHEWERGQHMASAFGVDGRRLACAICGVPKPGVSVPTERGAPDPDSPQWEACKVCGGDHWTSDHPMHREPGAPDLCPACGNRNRHAGWCPIASRPVPAPEPPYGERVHAPGCSQEWTCPCRRPAPEPSARLREALVTLAVQHHGPRHPGRFEDCSDYGCAAASAALDATPQDPEA